MTNVKDILKKLNIDETGYFDNHFYIVTLENSNTYANMYTTLSNNAINTEYPDFHVNTNNTTTKVTNYFEIEEGNVTYNIFLIADFDKDKYYFKIGEK